jgi:type IV secretory pathway ATPase VirB11/archaellum biosynthesis ATPase
MSDHEPSSRDEQGRRDRDRGRTAAGVSAVTGDGLGVGSGAGGAGGGRSDADRATDRYPVAAPVPPDDADAWYAPGVVDQREVHPGVVVTLRDAGGTTFDYETREPGLGPQDRAELATVREHFAASTDQRRPLTREGTRERAASGFSPKYRRVFDRLVDCTPAAKRRVAYHALAELRLLDDLTPVALDDEIETADVGRGGTGEDRLVVHTTDFTSAVTGFDTDAEFVERVAGERLRRYGVEFAGFEIDVVVYRRHLLGHDRFAVKYAVLEPDLLPGDEALVAECKDRIWEANAGDVLVDRTMDRPGHEDEPASAPGSDGSGAGADQLTDHRAFVRDRARQFLSRRLTARNAQAWLDSARYRIRRALAENGLAVPPVDSRYADDRLDDLVYYVLRDFVGYGILTIPIRDPHLEDVEANRVGERVKVVPRDEIARDGRVPTNLSFDGETEFVNVVTQIAASDGVELNASRPSAKVNLEPPGVDATIRCAVALPVVSEGGPHVSIRKQRADALTPVELVERDAVPTELVTLLWLLYEHRGVVLFSGPTGVGKTTLMNAHLPFIPYDDRPVSIDEGSREVRLPHETGIALTTRAHESDFKRVSMADLMTEANYLNPDVEIIAEVNSPASFETFGETINTGHGVVGTTHAEDVETLVNRVVEQGLPPYLLREIDLVVFPRHVDGERYVGEAIEFVEPDAAADLTGRSGVVEKGGRELHWNAVVERTPDDGFSFAYDHPQLDDTLRSLNHRVFHRIASATDRNVEDVEAEFHRKHNYVRYLVREGVDGFERLFDFLSDLRTDEAATVDRASRRPSDPPGDGDEGSQGDDGPSGPDSSGDSRPSGGATGTGAAGGSP